VAKAAWVLGMVVGMVPAASEGLVLDGAGGVRMKPHQ
jgi:hypothetical protein